MKSEPKNSIQLTIIAILVFFIILYASFVIYKQDKQIEELSKIEKPFYYEDINMKYFNYADIEFSLYTTSEKFYGCELTEENAQTSVYCNLDGKKCKVEFVNLTCLYESNPNLTEGILENTVGCINIYTLSGNLTKRVY